MKHVASFVLIFVLILAFVGTMSLTVFAEGEGESTISGGNIIDTLLEKVRGFVTADKLEALKAKLFELPSKLVSYVKSAATYENLLKALVAVAAIIIIPIVFGLVVIAYVTIGAMIIFAGALTAIVELLLTILSGLIVL